MIWFLSKTHLGCWRRQICVYRYSLVVLRKRGPTPTRTRPTRLSIYAAQRNTHKALRHSPCRAGLGVLDRPPCRICSIKPKRRGTAGHRFLKTDSTNRGEAASRFWVPKPTVFYPSFQGTPALALLLVGLAGERIAWNFYGIEKDEEGAWSAWSAQMAPGWDPFGAGGYCWDGMLCRWELRLRGCDQRSPGGWPRDVQCCRAAVLPWSCSVLPAYAGRVVLDGARKSFCLTPSREIGGRIRQDVRSACELGLRERGCHV